MYVGGVLIRLSKEIILRATTADQRRFVRDYLLPDFLAESLRGRFVREVALRGRLSRLRRALWCGASERARLELEAVKIDEESRSHEVAGAAWILGTYYASMGNWPAALKNAEEIRLAMPSYRALQGRVLLAADAMMAQGQRNEAYELILAALNEAPSNSHLLLALANTYATPELIPSGEGDAERLRLINSILTPVGLAPLRKRVLDAPLGIDNLAAPEALSVEQGTLVTIIVPAFRAEGTLGFVLRGLCEQTWRNVEILVVDDFSPDETFAIAEEYARMDSRVRAYRLSENRGAYAARNYALRRARGHFVTIHDADDWSHPQKIELQVRQLEDRPGLIANESEWVRAHPNLYFRGTARVSSLWITPNISSMMTRRTHLQQLGGWDEVRVAADSELQRRLMHMRDKGDLGRVMPGVPLSFALELSTSLTRRGATHVHTISYGVRRTYHEAAKFWLKDQPDPLPSLQSAPRSYPAPGLLLVGASRPVFDVVFVMDYRWISRELRDTWRCIRRLVDQKRRVGIFQLAAYGQNMGRRLPAAVLRASQEGLVYLVSPGEEIECGAAFVMKPELLTYKVDLAPRLTCEKLSLVVRRPPRGVLGSRALRYDPESTLAFAEQSFGIKAEWMPRTALTRNQLRKLDAFKCLAPNTFEDIVRAP